MQSSGIEPVTTKAEGQKTDAYNYHATKSMIKLIIYNSECNTMKE